MDARVHGVLTGEATKRGLRLTLDQETEGSNPSSPASSLRVERRTPLALSALAVYLRTVRVLRIGLAAEDLAGEAALGAMRPRVPDNVRRRDRTPR